MTILSRTRMLEITTKELHYTMHVNINLHEDQEGIHGPDRTKKFGQKSRFRSDQSVRGSL